LPKGLGVGVVLGSGCGRFRDSGGAARPASRHLLQPRRLPSWKPPGPNESQRERKRETERQSERGRPASRHLRSSDAFVAPVTPMISSLVQGVGFRQ